MGYRMGWVLSKGTGKMTDADCQGYTQVVKHLCIRMGQNRTDAKLK